MTGIENPLAVRMAIEGLDYTKPEDYERLSWILFAEVEKLRDALEIIEVGDSGHAGRIARKCLGEI